MNLVLFGCKVDQKIVFCSKIVADLVGLKFDSSVSRTYTGEVLLFFQVVLRKFVNGNFPRIPLLGTGDAVECQKSRVKNFVTLSL